MSSSALLQLEFPSVVDSSVIDAADLLTELLSLVQYYLTMLM